MNGFRDWLTSAFGTDGGRAVQMVLALLLVVGLLLVLAWMFRRLFGGGFSSHKGGRLSVLDSAPVDGRRRLILLRRDDVEHLVMIGGPNDVLVESRIMRGAPVIAQGGMPQRASASPSMRMATSDETDARPIEDRSEAGVGRGGVRAGTMAAMGAAVAGAGAFIKAKTARGAAEDAPEVRRTVDQAFDAPLGRASSAGQREQAARDVAPKDLPPRIPEPVELPLPPAAVAPPAIPAVPTETTGRRAPVPPMPPQAMMGRGGKPTPPPPPPAPTAPAQESGIDALAAKLAPVVAAAAAVEPSIEEALFEPSPIAPGRPAEPVVDPISPPVPPVKPAPKSLDDIDLLSELNLGLEEFVRLDPKSVVPAPPPVAPIVLPPVPSAPVMSPPSISLEPKPIVDPAPAPAPVKAPKIPKVEPPSVAAPVSTAAPEAPQAIDRLEFLFEEAMLTGVGSEPAVVVPEVKLDAVPAPATAPAPVVSEETVVVPPITPAAPPVSPPRQAVDELEEEMARLLAEISGQQKR